MDAIVKHCLAVADLYFKKHYHIKIDESLKFVLCESLTNIIASYILPHNEFLCFVAYHMLILNNCDHYKRLKSVDDFSGLPLPENKNEDKKDEGIVSIENTDLKNVDIIYDELMHACLVDFCKNYNF